MISLRHGAARSDLAREMRILLFYGWKFIENNRHFDHSRDVTVPAVASVKKISDTRVDRNGFI